VNKKNLPKAIMPSLATASGAGVAPEAAAPETAAPIHNLEPQELNGKAAAAMAMPEPSSPAAPASPSAAAKKATSPEAAKMPPQGRYAVASKTVERFALWSGAAGFIPVPVVDLTVVSGLQVQMLHRISQIYGVPFSENRGKVLIATLAGSMIPATSGIGAASILKSVPIVGTAVSSAVMPALAAGATYAIGMAFVEHFATGGTLLDFNPPDYRGFIKVQKLKWRMRSRGARAAAKGAPPAN